MTRPPVLLLAAVLFASCAPTLQDTAGRVVNVRSGQEGTIRFPAGLPTRALLPGDPDNVVVTLGQDRYSGKATVLGEAPPLGLSVSFAGGYQSGGGPDGFFSGVGVQAPGGPRPGSATRPGNLIAKTPQGKTLSCTFQVDRSGHGIGDCQDSAGGTYTLQF
ncbi:hypothetical protein [Deinococcus sonorensis]|uniref:Lipoprotein n=2 Tax=Deinococcus sonorensis TaxID=309891 RepID=A0AAU7UD38_9DEIO